MKKNQNLKRILFATLMVTGLFMYKTVSAFNTPVEATNCSYTGNGSDYCYASNGSSNLKVTNCRPGESSCSYDAPIVSPEL